MLFFLIVELQRRLIKFSFPADKNQQRLFYSDRLDRDASYYIEKNVLAIYYTHAYIYVYTYVCVAFVLGCETIRSLCCETYPLLVLNADYARVCVCVYNITRLRLCLTLTGVYIGFFDQRRPQPIIKRRIVRTLFDCVCPLSDNLKSLKIIRCAACCRSTCTSV